MLGWQDFEERLEAVSEGEQRVAGGLTGIDEQCDLHRLGYRLQPLNLTGRAPVLDDDFFRLQVRHWLALRIRRGQEQLILCLECGGSAEEQCSGQTDSREMS